MKEIAGEIRLLIDSATDTLAGMSREAVEAKPSSSEWSKKEILGHLIDSAANNHQRFVRAMYDAASDFPPYRQEEWVAVQQYQQSSWMALIELWGAYNRHLCDLIDRMPHDVESSPVNIGTAEPATLAFVVKDYLRHLRQHMQDLIG